MKKIVLTMLLSCAVALSWPWTAITNAATVSDTVTVVPVKPSENDSLTISLRTSNHCCCTQYTNQKVTVNDSAMAIYLFDSYNEQNCPSCECFVAGSTIKFSSGPIPAGKYRVFWSEDMYCPPGKICPAIAIPVHVVQVGEIIVTPEHSTDLIPDSKVTKSKQIHSVLSYSGADKRVILKLAKSQFVLVTAYVVNGEKSTEFSSKKYLQAGTHSFRMDQQRFKSGVVVIHVKGENFSEVRMINLTK